MCWIQHVQGAPTDVRVGWVSLGVPGNAGTCPAVGQDHDIWSLFLKYQEFEKSLGCNKPPIFPTIPAIMTLAH